MRWRRSSPAGARARRPAGPRGGGPAARPSSGPAGGPGRGAVTKRWEYDPFGSIRTQSGSVPSDFGYADEQRDGETGLVNLRARYYDPALGRFLSRDVLSGTPTAPQSFNRYAYVANNPVRHVDPSGHDYPGEDNDDEEKKARDCANAGRYTGSCPGGPPDPEYNRQDEEDAEAKELGKALQALARSVEAQQGQQAADNGTEGSLLPPIGGVFLTAASLEIIPITVAALPLVPVAVLLARLAVAEATLLALPGGQTLLTNAYRRIAEAAAGSAQANRFAQGLVVQAERIAQYVQRGAGRVAEVERRFVDSRGGRGRIDYVVEEGEFILETINVEVKYWPQSTAQGNLGRLADQAGRVLDATRGTLQRAEERLRIEFVKTPTDAITSTDWIERELVRRNIDVSRIELVIVEHLP